MSVIPNSSYIDGAALAHHLSRSAFLLVLGGDHCGLPLFILVPSLAEDAKLLLKAFVRWDTDENGIISILAHRSAAQCRLIRQHYAQGYAEDLLKSLDKEIAGDFERAVPLWTLDPAVRNASLLNEAARKWHHNSVEIACTRSSEELFAILRAYRARYKQSIEEDVAAYTSGDFCKLLVPLVSAYRCEEAEVNMTLAKSEAKIFHGKMAKKVYSHEEINRILTTKSEAQVLATLNRYNK